MLLAASCDHSRPRECRNAWILMIILGNRFCKKNCKKDSYETSKKTKMVKGKPKLIDRIRTKNRSFNISFSNFQMKLQLIYWAMRRFFTLFCKKISNKKLNLFDGKSERCWYKWKHLLTFQVGEIYWPFRSVSFPTRGFLGRPCCCENKKFRSVNH